MQWPDPCESIENKSLEIAKIIQTVVIYVRQYETWQNEKERYRQAADGITVWLEAEFPANMMDKYSKGRDESQSR